jgi:hypothetical protein
MATTFNSRDISLGRAVTQNHEGMNVGYGYYTANGVSLSAGDTIQMVKVPNRAIILDWMLSGFAGTAATVFSVGDGGDTDRYGVTATLSATSALKRMDGVNGAATGHGYQISLSDDAADPRHETIDLLVVSGTSTVTCSIVLTVWYKMPPA